MSGTNGKETHTRQLLLSAAITTFQQKGFQKSRISDIVAEAGVAQGTFYLYFRSKEAIFRDICAKFMERLSHLFISRTANLFDGTTEDEIKNKVRHIIQGMFEIYTDDIAVAELLFREGIGNGGVFKEIYEDIQFHFITLIQEQLREGIERGMIGFDDPETGSVFIFGIVERSLLYFLLVQKNFDIKTLQEQMLSFILKGMSFKFPSVEPIATM